MLAEKTHPYIKEKVVEMETLNDYSWPKDKTFEIERLLDKKMHWWNDKLCYTEGACRKKLLALLQAHVGS